MLIFFLLPESDNVYFDKVSDKKSCVMFIFSPHRRVIALRQNRAAITIQRYMKGWYQRTKFVEARQSVMAIQRFGRGFIARKRFNEKMNNHKATIIQKYCRGYLARKKFNEKIRKIVIVQSCVRRFLAKRKFRKLKAEARSISHLETKYKGLENKIIELQQKYDATHKENLVLRSQSSAIPELRQVASSFFDFCTHFISIY